MALLLLQQFNTVILDFRQIISEIIINGYRLPPRVQRPSRQRVPQYSTVYVLPDETTVFTEHFSFVTVTNTTQYRSCSSVISAPSTNVWTSLLTYLK